ncbi:hypothetical protein BJ508DRAFT_323323 [Ascobolus immersus RN42]|uniref:Uncharacterized protein n=1 Tax=Ascobolus immersus RN42 TaxID=1160509 RepID=A0A3N4IF52_ASCIM|nr:hypothetical protein BJ508DRAFT_323323 [Ascobolus immersus RN42]
MTYSLPHFDQPPQIRKRNRLLLKQAIPTERDILNAATFLNTIDDWCNDLYRDMMDLLTLFRNREVDDEEAVDRAHNLLDRLPQEVCEEMVEEFRKLIRTECGKEGLFAELEDYEDCYAEEHRNDALEAELKELREEVERLREVERKVKVLDIEKHFLKGYNTRLVKENEDLKLRLEMVRCAMKAEGPALAKAGRKRSLYEESVEEEECECSKRIKVLQNDSENA